MKNLAYYSLKVDPTGTRERQLITSIASLRQHNKFIPIHLCLYGQAPNSLLEHIEAFGVDIHAINDYMEFLARFVPTLALPLSYVTTLHKFPSLTLLPIDASSRVLYLDCDTYFFGNVDKLFERYSAHNFYAREEPKSSRSPHGYDSSYIDEAALLAITQLEGVTYVPPYNAGVCLLNGEIGSEIATLSAELLRNAWRLIVGNYLDPQVPGCIDAQLGGIMGQLLTKADKDSALAFPSANQWLVDAIALFLTLGRIPTFTHDIFLREDVVQSGEFLTLHGEPHCTLAHYFTRYEKLFFAWSWKRERETDQGKK